MRLVFLGTPQFAVPTLAALLDAGHDVALVVTQPDRPGRHGQRPVPPAVARYARERGLPLWQTSTLRGDDAEARLRAVDAPVMALAAFAALVPKNVLALPRHGILNVHPSLLPRWRGASPIQAALRAGDTETGVSIIRLVQAMDAGPILLQQSAPIAPDDDYLTLEPRLAELGARLLVDALRQVARGTAREQPQDEAAATYSGRIERADALVDWHQPAVSIANQVRAYRGWPQAHTTWDARLLKLLRAHPTPGPASAPPGTVAAVAGTLAVATAAGALAVDELVLEGKRPQPGADFLRGYPAIVGARLGT
jgi:methionyl-tRNA formyltransferase